MMWKKVGVVIVDSGRVSLIKEKDLALWTGSGEGEPIALSFWGRDEEKVVQFLQEHEVPVYRSDSLCYVKINECPEAINLYKNIAEQKDIIVVDHLVKNNPYDRLFLGDNKVMQIQSDSKECFYTTSTYMGDGIYTVLQNGHDYLVPFVQNPKMESAETLNSFKLEEPTSYLFCDPCYLSYGTKYAATVTLEPNIKYNVLVLKKDGLPAGFMLNAKN
jgi:hypothetical protein